MSYVSTFRFVSFNIVAYLNVQLCCRCAIVSGMSVRKEEGQLLGDKIGESNTDVFFSSSFFFNFKQIYSV